MMDLEPIYGNIECKNIKDASGAQTQRNSQDKGKDGKIRGRVCLVLMTVSLGLICVLLLVFIIWLNISITAEGDLLKRYETTVQEFNHTINSLQTNYTDLTTEKDQLKKSLSSLSQKNQESETRVKDLSAEKEQLQKRFDSLSQKNQELERNVSSLGEELKRKASKQGSFFLSTEKKSWSESRKFCRDRGADLVMIKTEDKQNNIALLVKERVWIGLTDTDTEGTMKWVDNSPLNQGFWLKGEPNDQGGSEDCIELMPEKPVLNNWNDLPCSEKKIGMCEK